MRSGHTQIDDDHIIHHRKKKLDRLESKNAKTFLESIIEKIVKFDKVKKSCYLSLLEKIVYDDGVSGV